MSEPLLQVRGLEAWYGESHVLHGVNIDINAGEVVTLLGRNGAGKTSTLRAIMGLTGKRAGSVKFQGKELISARPDVIARAGIAYCPEERGIFASLNVGENLVLPPEVLLGGLNVPKSIRCFPICWNARAARAPSCRAGSSRCWRSGASCAPDRRCCCWTNQARGWPR